MRISDWSSDVCSSDLEEPVAEEPNADLGNRVGVQPLGLAEAEEDVQRGMAEAAAGVALVSGFLHRQALPGAGNGRRLGIVAAGVGEDEPGGGREDLLRALEAFARH